MKKLLLVITILILFMLVACTGNTSTSLPMNDADTVATIVAGTLTAFPSVTSTLETAAAFTQEPPSVLPQSLYYSAKDSSGKFQIYRLGRNGISVTQITFEQMDVLNFDVTSIDGSIAYIIESNLIVTDADGNNRQSLVQDPNIQYSLSWSPDGKMISYQSGNDVVIYSLTTGDNEVLISGSETETNWPVSFSPDSKKLLIRQRINPSAPGGWVLIYDFATQSLTPMGAGQPKNGSNNCYNGNVTWDSPDVFFCHKDVFAGGGGEGVWRVNANDGSVEALIFSESCPPCSPVAAPHQNSDGYLYYLYREVENIDNPHPSLLLTRSKTDGVTDRVILRPETFTVSYALWTPDGNALLIAQNNGTSSTSTNLILIPVDPSLPVVTILSDASNFGSNSPRWGQP